MKKFGFTLLALLILLPAAARSDDDSPLPRTVKTQAKNLSALGGEENQLPLTRFADPIIADEYSFTWGDVFYGGPTFALLFSWEEQFTLLTAGGTEDDRRLTVYPAFGGVMGFRIGGHGFLTAHLELGLALVMPQYFTREINLYPRVTAGPDFNLGGGWRLSAEVDYFFAYVGYGLGVSYSF